ncbi:DUF6231 family protein [Psychrobacter sp. M13]|uniref:DUF6231 family protein n=1 Tax=Psychrobacter sp. M13 TaxID=3067275 RepID=UPI00273CD343|nr:DUF6231 family protein [Psychrobacter sp. M13]WLP95551.1 DUF6231 family protein [Psychrobacter sp. M13]
MQNNLKSPKVTLPLLVAYVTELSTTLKDKDKNTDLLWVTENKDALSLLNDQAYADTATSYAINATAITLLALAKQTSLSRYNLACFWLPTLTEETLQPYIPLMMRYRDLYAAHLIIAVSQEIDLRHYGLIPLDIVNHEQAAPYAALDITIWQFNIYDYKQLPNWLNSDYWANPENWDKRRW